jgi:hypothetical protein
MPAIDDYLAKLPADRRAALSAVRDTVNRALPAGYEEGLQYGMLAWFVPADRLAETYNGQPLVYAALASQKHFMALYLMAVYGDPAIDKWFRAEYTKRGKKLDMGKSCVRFKTLADLPLDLVAETIAKVGIDEYIARYHAVRAATKTKTKKPVKTPPVKAKPMKKPAAKKKPVAKKKPAKKKPTNKKPVARRR